MQTAATSLVDAHDEIMKPKPSGAREPLKARLSQLRSSPTLILATVCAGIFNVSEPTGLRLMEAKLLMVGNDGGVGE